MNRSKSIHLRTGVVIIVSVLLLFAVFFIFRNRLDTKLRASEEEHLTENANTVSEVFYTKLDDQLTMLESQARYFQSIDLTDYNAMKRTILSTKGIGGFKNIGVANSSGATINYNGTSSGNIYLSGYYREAMQGKNAISEKTILDEDGDYVLVLAVPIMKDGKAAGVIYGTFTIDTIEAIIDSISISKYSSNILVGSDGMILAHSSNAEVKDAEGSITDIIPKAEITGEEKERMIYYTSGDDGFIADMIPIGLHGWYFVTIQPETIITDLTSRIMLYVGFVIIAVAVVFAIILIHIRNLLKNSDRFMEQASNDSLTNILNKGAFRAHFCEQMDKNKARLALFIIDLDDFKAVNDNLGHVMGDKVLTDTADKLSEIFGSRESVGRIGGDEFSAFLPFEGESGNVTDIAARVCESIEQDYTAHGATVHVSVSVGIAVYPESGDDYEELYRNADKALYSVKSSGKNMYALYSSEEAADDE